MSTFDPTEGAVRYDVVIMGVSGVGKSSVAARIADATGWTLIEGDDFHTPASLQKMHDGIPLTDDDRWPWLADLRQQLENAPASVVLACSALRRSYRDLLRLPGRRTHFVLLTGTPSLIAARLEARAGHFMSLRLLSSQLSLLEDLEPDEPGSRYDIELDPTQIADSVIREILRGRNTA